MKKLLFALLLLGGYTSFAQSVVATLKGRVVGSKNEPLLGASIALLPDNKYFITDQDGNFTLEGLPAAREVRLKFSYSGYTATERVVDLSSGTAPDLVVVLQDDPLELSAVVVTGVANPVSKLTSSVSISTIKVDDIQKSSPRTTAEIFRTIPGIKAEASGGEGNTNITVRGVPISSGGSKYLQLQEDGLPVLQFGDIAFATSDIFLRADQTLARVEAIRGGSASTLGTNSPAGIINFISKTGQKQGGSIGMSAGLDYGNFRTDFNYGAPIGNGFHFNVGGFYRLGEGPRTAGFTANNGGQLKLNLTKNFANGYVRLYAKYLNDRAASYMPTPLQVTGTNSRPTYSAVEGFDPKHGALQSPYLLHDLGLGVNGALRQANVADGMHPVSSSIGAEFNFDLGENWSIENRARYSLNKGRFISPFPATAGSTSAMLSAIAGAQGWNLTNARLTDAATGAAFTGSQAMLIHMFDVELNNFNNFVNDFKLKKDFGAGSVTFGFYKAYQNIAMSWLWNSYLTTLSGKGLRPLDITNASGTRLTQNGQFAYGVPLWGNLQRDYNTAYNMSAPYVSTSWEVTPALNVDASVRWDFGRVNGTYSGGTTVRKDMNNDGVILASEEKVAAIDYASTKPVNYRYNYGSFSLGANYKLQDNQSVFARYSSGATTKADRILFTNNVLADGSIRGVKDQIDQAELGYKGNLGFGGLFVTAFYSRVNEQGGFEATTQRVIANHYRSFGLEIETIVKLSTAFSINASATLTDAKITQGDNRGNFPRRQSPLIFTFLPSYTAGPLSIGVSTIGTAGSYTQDVNQLKMKGYVLFNPYINYRFSSFLTGTVSANNITNTLGLTEAEEASITDNATNIIRARSITGRTISASLLLTF
ncbi:TonB-dependent receptor [Siphonobacter sp. BAB-5385]|uniref:TonB-dependent receptor n=1 Tax=Siphonobacter sp. BAB-5385 TaxID=1864822 RepID=UPI000B9DD3D5|nr:TonB-dependent receptor [Siphonobacter sp. BAB-5385]OZI07062.1 TonB-dependent receptor [Siphonobacter sp. BAB-5385]